MANKKMRRTFVAATLVLAAVMVLVSAGCASPPPSPPPVKSERELAIERATPIRTEPAQRPGWIDAVPSSPTDLNFVGTSLRYATAAQARDNAQENGRRQLVDYYGTLMVNKGREYSASYGISNEVFSPQVAAQQLNERIAQNVAQALDAKEFYTQVFLDDTNREAFEVNVLMGVDKAIVARVIDNYGKEAADELMKQAAAEQDDRRREQMEKAAEFFGGNLSSSLGF
ncbi:MAG: hypothetical protein LBJ41_03355 [Treponema sp.]|jgi:hypothetical protein|nr:hypothetical protein [Treponema sp.]